MSKSLIIIEYRRVENGYILKNSSGMYDEEYVAATSDDLRNKSELIFEQELERVISKVSPKPKGPTE